MVVTHCCGVVAAEGQTIVKAQNGNTDAGWMPPVTLQFVDPPKSVLQQQATAPEGTTLYGNLDVDEVMRDLDGEDVKRKWDDLASLRQHLNSHEWLEKEAASNKFLAQLYANSPSCHSSTVLAVSVTLSSAVYRLCGY